MTKQNIEVVEDYASSIRSEQGANRLKLALRGSMEDSTNWIKTSIEYILSRKKEWKDKRVSPRQLGFATLAAARLGLAPGWGCHFLAFGKDQPDVKLHITQDGWKMLLALVPGLSFSQPVAVHVDDTYKPPHLQLINGVPTFMPVWESTGSRFSRWDDVVAVMGTLTRHKQTELLHLNKRDLDASRQAGKSNQKYDKDPEAMARAVWIRRAAEKVGAKDLARLALQQDRQALETVDFEDAGEQHQLAQTPEPAKPAQRKQLGRPESRNSADIAYGSRTARDQADDDQDTNPIPPHYPDDDRDEF